MFSNAVKIGDLNDFIAPSQSCVVQTGSSSDALKIKIADEPEGLVQLQPRNTPSGFKQTYSDKENGPVKVTLHDCLACSGCVTSAETVLLQHQSIEELEQQLARPDVHVVVTVSPQSRASLAALHGIPAAQVQARLTAALHQLGAAAVLDLGPARQLALTEAAAEFLDRYQRSREATTSAPNSSPLTTAAAAAGAGGVTAGAGAAAAAGGRQGPGGRAGGQRGGQLPMLASACPGWIVYAEKTHGEFILPYISTTKSPQAIMGTLVKRHLAASLGWHPAGVYHVTVMPCYDKKLEAVREDYVLPGTTTPEVDATLTTGELQQLLEQAGLGDLATAPAAQLDTHTALLLPSTQPPAAAPAAAAADDMEVDGVANGYSPHHLVGGSEPQQQQQQQEPMSSAAAGNCGGSCTCSGNAQQQLGQQQQQQQEGQLHQQPGGSGGYMEYIFRAAASQLFGAHLYAPEPLTTKVLRNADFQELLLQDSNGVVLLRFAAAYGFRNIQTLMRKIKLGRCEYDYVEVMACPGGCLNGAGQLKPREGQTAAQLLEQLEMLYYVPPESAAAVDGAGCSMCGGDSRGGSCNVAAAGQQQQQQQQQQGGTASAVRCEPGVITLLEQPRVCGVPHQQQQQQQQQQEGCVAGSGRPQVACGAQQLCSRRAAATGLYDSWVGDVPGSAAAKQLLHTQYRHRQKTAAAAVGDW